MRALKSVLPVVAWCVGLVSVAWASGGGETAAHGGGHGAPHISWWAWDRAAPGTGWLILDFAIFLVLVVRYGGPWLSKQLASRHDVVRVAIAEAATAKAQAEEKARQYEARIRNLDAEIKAIRDEFQKGGEAVRDKLVESGRIASERIARDATLTIGAEMDRARVALQEEAARLALELAEGMVRERLTDADRARFRDDFIKELRS